MIIAGRITLVFERPPALAFQSPRWTVYFTHHEGTQCITLHSYDKDVLPPMENETIQLIPWTYGYTVFVSARRFSEYVPPDVFRRPRTVFDEYSRVDVPADISRASK
jgi:hypothetical protein